MKLISWNVNGLRACINKGFIDFFNTVDADIFSIQETKMQENQVDQNIMSLSDNVYFSSALKKGYSGTATFSKIKPIKVIKGIDSSIALKLKSSLHKENLLIEENDEGRIIVCEYNNFFLINCYIPNSKRGLERLDYRAEFEDEMREYLIELDKIKPIIYCGDLNVAHEEIDLKNPSSNHNNAGFTDVERLKMSNLLNAGFVDTFRYKYPDKKDSYSWWSYMFHARENNAGWRIDYFIVSSSLKDHIIDAKIHQNVFGSDHCPIELDIEIN